MIALSSTLFLGVLAAAPATPHLRVSTVPAASGPWLTHFNAWRANTGTSPLTENATWSTGDYDHALYMVKNDLVTHYETPGTPYYTSDGDTAARNSNIYVSSSTATTDEQAIDWWMQAPFHAMGMMDPRLSSTGFGSYREVKSGWNMGAAVDVLRGNPFSGGRFPVVFPGDGTSEPLTSYGGGEYPDPLQACSGYTAPTGLPVFIELGGNVATTVGAVHSFTANGVPLAHCVIDSSNPSLGSNLTYRGGVILIPRQPLGTGVKYTVALTVNGNPYTWSFSIGSLSATNTTYCTSVTASPAPVSPSAAGTQVTVSAAATGCPNPRYRFWVSPPGGGWQIVQDYSAVNTFLWTATAAAGDYRLEVDARDASETVTYDAVANLNYSLVSCMSLGLSASPSLTSGVGTVVTLTGTATCAGTPMYRFWVGQNGTWKIVQDYSAANTFAWSTVGLVAGAYGLEVDVRPLGSTAAYERVANLTYSLTTTAGPCSTPALNASPTGSAATGATATFTASTSGCPTPNYRFWVGQNGIWRILQDYSAASTFSWNTAGYAPGTYGVEVDVRDQSTSVPYDRLANLTYTLNGCTAAHLATDKASPQVYGTTVLLTGSATCPGTADYRFWVGRSGIWKIVQDYGPTSAFSWNTTGLSAGTYGLEVDVRDHGSTASYEAVANIYFNVVSPCSAAHLASDKPSPEVHGTTIVLTGSATCGGTPEYRFWVGQNGAWKIVQDYSPSNTFSWNTAGAAPGTYGLEVDVRNQGSTLPYDAVSNLTYVIT